ncbi:Asp/Glu/hydantoin racemase [Xylariaceae sp. AK1471]|nr:Asp/Glu/hydantoin racemase [Xylariaceae sp. AK1471]
MSTTLVRGRGSKILLLNPNSSSSMTDGMKAVINDIDLPYSTEVYTYTGPSGSPTSINDGHDIQKSRDTVLGDFNTHNEYNGIVVACFSVHPLVPELQSLSGSHCVVTGIFEASVLTAISLLETGQKWGIVTTGKFWEDHLSDGVKTFLGANVEDGNNKFAGVESTGLNASDFHNGVDPAIVRHKLKKATKRLLAIGQVHVIVMGCAGMAGLEDIIREAASDECGEEFAYSTLHIIDGVRAGVMQVDHMIRNQRLRPGGKS